MRRHRFDPVSLLFGGLFVLIATVFLVGDPDLTSVRLQWVWPLGVIVRGALIILLALARGRGDDEFAAEPVPAGAAGAPAHVDPWPGAPEVDPWPGAPEREHSAEAIEQDDDAMREADDGVEPVDLSDDVDEDGAFSEERSLP
jgi:hypothetical protein